MTSKSDMLRSIPKVDDLLNDPALSQICGESSHFVVTDSIRKVLNELREGILSDEISRVWNDEEILERIKSDIKKASLRNLRKVINGTGIILHTNLGRAKLGQKAIEAVVEAAGNYSTLEYDVESGSRGSRYDHVNELIEKLTGAESCLVVNNNAAAVLLILSTMTKGKEVVISRGELVEIGGSFRVPDIMEQSESMLVEVGTTNKTHISDYKRAIRPEITGALLKVHTSNFRIMGFTQEVSLEEMVELGHLHGVPVIHDLGSGSMVDLERYGIKDEPSVIQSMSAGADVVSFSGDKLFGGPQAGIIIGRKVYIDAMKKNPLTRAFRIDKMTLAALEATLRLYLDPMEAETQIPTISMLAKTSDDLREKAEQLCKKICEKVDPSYCHLQVVEEVGQVGGGSVPTQLLDTWAVAISSENTPATFIELKMRENDIPIIGRISKGRYLLDVRTIEEKDFEIVAACLSGCFVN